MVILNLTAEAAAHWEDGTGTTHIVSVELNGHVLATIDAGFMPYPDDPAAVTEVVARWARGLIELEEYRAKTAALRDGRSAADLKARDNRVVHHIDGDPTNNDPSNLRIMTRQEGP